MLQEAIAFHPHEKLPPLDSLFALFKEKLRWTRRKSLEKLMDTPKCHRCGADLVQIKLTEDSEVGWYCVGCDADIIGEKEEAPTEIDLDRE
jgi:hypothetical protein